MTEQAVAVPRQGEMLGRFRVDQVVGAGGMGLVVSAHDPDLDRRVALKLLRPRADGHARALQARGRLLREAQAMARLSHPAVVTVYEAGILGDQVFIAMELVAGGTLADWVGAKSRSWREIVAMFSRAGRGLAAAHKMGLVHRDFRERTCRERT